MRYSVHFFALKLAEFAGQLQQPGALLPTVDSFIRSAGDFSDAEVSKTLEDVESICRGTLPNECEYDQFEALCWLADAVGEKLAIPGFELIKGGEYIDQIGFWPLLTEEMPPVVLPTCTAAVPAVGFATNSRLHAVVHPRILALCDAPSEPSILRARQDFEEVIESVSLEGLDLLAILL